MSGVSRQRKADIRAHARFVAQRDRIRALQQPVWAGGQDVLDEVYAALVAGRFIVCDPDGLARRWCRNHPGPLPAGIGVAYRARHRRSW